MKHLVSLLMSLHFALSVGAQNYETDVIRLRDDSQLKITFIGHGSLVFTYNDKVIYIDPAATTADFANMPQGALLVYTHHHGDHFDIPTAQKLSSEETICVGSKDVISALQRGEVMNNGDTRTYLGDITIEAVAAYNTTEGHTKFHPKGRDNGYIFVIGGSRIYVAGDSEPIEEMSQLGEIDIAFLPVNQPYTMTIEQALEAVKTIKPKIFYPYHFSETPVEQLKDKLSGSGVEVRIRSMK